MVVLESATWALLVWVWYQHFFINHQNCDWRHITEMVLSKSAISLFCMYSTEMAFLESATWALLVWVWYQRFFINHQNCDWRHITEIVLSKSAISLICMCHGPFHRSNPSFQILIQESGKHAILPVSLEISKTLVRVWWRRRPATVSCWNSS